MGDHLNHDDYAVAWIAVLPIEAEAALGMLDKQHHCQFESVRGDDYIYIGGEINGHNVVVATLPVGQNYGIVSAAALVNQVKARFSNLWFALLVGVAAGLPNLLPSDPIRLRDIRLGDVLVCVPNEASSGIVYYDLGRDTEARFLPNGQQTETPAIVRLAIGNIKLTKKKPYKEGNEFTKYLNAFQQAHKDDKFLCSSQDTDRLWPSSVDTTVPPAPISREPRDESERTRVWYGKIGSGNSMVRNPRRRNELRDRYDLVSLEMEAAGIINILPTGMVRGVCDYGNA
jgi:nucleoside phosphorylase